jgi:hypothetical protein
MGGSSVAAAPPQVHESLASPPMPTGAIFKNESIKRLAWMIGIMLVVYSSVLALPYGFLDDYEIGSWVYYKPLSIIPALSVQGRPVSAVLELAAYYPIYHVSDFAWLRLIGIIGLGLLAWVFSRIMIRAGWSVRAAIPIAVMVATLPPMQVLAAWAIEFSYPWAAVVALLAAAVWADSVPDGAPPDLRREIRYGAASVALLLFSLVNNQPVAMIFWAAAAVDLFKPGSTIPHLYRRGFGYLAIGFLAMALEFVILKLAIHIYPHEFMAYRAALTTAIRTKIRWFIKTPLRHALNLQHFPGTAATAIAVGVAIVVGLLLYFPGNLLSRAKFFAAALLLIPLSYLPNLAVAESVPFYRTEIGLTTLILVYAWLAVNGFAAMLSRRSPGQPPSAIGLALLRAAAVCACVVAAFNVLIYFALPQTLEYRFLREKLASADLRAVRHILVIQPSSGETLAPGAYPQEFGLPSMSEDWVPIGMIQMTLRDLHLPIIDSDFEMTGHPHADGTVARAPDAATLVIDMRQITAMRDPSRN